MPGPLHSIPLAALAALALAACAVEPVSNDLDDRLDAEDSASPGAGPLSSAAREITGGWAAGAARGPDPDMYYASLDLGPDGRYTGSVADPRVRCERAPCPLRDSGEWNAYRTGSDLKVRLTSTRYGRKVYVATVSAAEVSLSRQRTTVTLKRGPGAPSGEKSERRDD